MRDLDNRRKLDEALIRAGGRPRFGAIQPDPYELDPLNSGYAGPGADPLGGGGSWLNDIPAPRSAVGMLMDEQGPRPAPRYEDLQGAQDEYFAGLTATRQQAERDFAASLTPGGRLAQPFANALFDEDRQQPIVDMDWLGDQAEGVGDYFAGGGAGRDVESAARAAPGAIASIPQRVNEAAGAFPDLLDNSMTVARGLVGMLPDDPMEAASAQRALQSQVGQAAIEYGPDIARGLTYGPWEDERQHQYDLDYAEALGDEEGMASAADAANLDTLFAGLNLAFAPADLASLGNTATKIGRGWRGAADNAGEDILQAARAPDPLDVPFEVVDDVLPDAGSAARPDGGSGALPAVDSAPTVTGSADDLPTLEARAPIDPLGENTPLRSLRTPEEQGAWAEEALVHIAPDLSDETRSHVYGFQGPNGAQMAITIESPRVDHSRGFVDLENLSRQDASAPLVRPTRANRQERYFTPDEVPRIIERAAAAIAEDARTRGLKRYDIFSADPVLGRAYRMASRNIEPPPGYVVQVDGDIISIVRQPDAPRPTEARAQTARPDETTSEAIRRMPLLEAGALAGGGAVVGAALNPEDAEADAGDPLVTSPEDFVLPILGAGAGLALFGRGARGAVRELDNSVGMGARAQRQERLLAAIRDPDTGRIYTGANHAEALDSAPPEIQDRLMGLYEANDQSVRGFARGDEFMGYDEALDSLGEGAFGRAHDPLGSPNGSTDVNANPQRSRTERGTESYSLPGLSPSQNKVVEMRRNGFTNAEIAEEMDTSLEVVRSLLSQARRRGAEFGEASSHGLTGVNSRTGESTATIEEIVALREKLREAGYTNSIDAGRNGESINALIAQRLGISRNSVKSRLSTYDAALRRNGGDRNAALLIAGGLGAGALALGGDEADAQERDTITEDGFVIDPAAELPSMTQAVGAPTVSGSIFIQEFSDGSRHAFRLNREGERADPEYLGEVLGTELEPDYRVGTGDPITTPAELSDPFAGLPPPTDLSDANDQNDSWELPAAARLGLSGAAGIATNILFPRRFGRVARDIATGLVTGGVDRVAGGDTEESVALGVATPLAMRVGRGVVSAAAREDAGITPDFVARRDAFAASLPESDIIPDVRVQRVDVDPLDGYAYVQGFPRQEALTEGLGFETRQSDDIIPNLREQFLDLPPAQQMRWMDREGFTLAPNIRDQTNLFESIPDSGQIVPQVRDPLAGSPPQLPAPDAPESFDPLLAERRYRVTPEEIMDDPGRRGALLFNRARGSARAASELAAIAEEYGVEVARGSRGAVNGAQTGVNLARAAASNPELADLLKNRGLWAVVLAAAAGNGASAPDDELDPLTLY